MEEITLNDRQKKAILHQKGPMLVLAGPGSGKTTVIVNRIFNLIKNCNVKPSEILVITFTKLASVEMKERFFKISGSTEDKVFFGTFHSYFFKIIRNFFNYSLENILSDFEKISILKAIISSSNASFDSEEEFIQSIINDISILKNELINPDVYNPLSCSLYDFLQIFNQYEKIKNSRNKIDFDDMLIKCYTLLKENYEFRKAWTKKYKYILIDEFQDINKVQYECIKLLVNKEENIFAVGDDDQSIYNFRGSRPDFLFKFLEDFKNVKKVVLNVNYRSTDEIISLCNNIISDNEHRFQKDLVGTGKTYKTPVLIRPYDTTEEAKFIINKIKEISLNIPLEEIAILYRTNIQARAIVENLGDSNISYQVKDGIFSIYDHWITKDILDYLTLALNDTSNESFLRIVNKPKRYIGKDFLNDCFKNCNEHESLLKYICSSSDLKSYQLEKLHNLKFHLRQIKNKNTYDAIKYIIKNVGYEDYLQDYADFKRIKVKGLINIVYEILETSSEYTDILEYLNNIKAIALEIKKKSKNNEKKGVVLSTIHSVKGLEFNTVFIISCIEGFIPHEKCKALTEIEEERRLFYVGLTRAKQLLYISVIKSKYEQNVKQSRFLNNLVKQT